MKPIQEALPDGKEVCSRGDYYRLLTAMDVKVILFLESDGYKGDALVFLKYRYRYGILNFAWGSCTTSDALKACENYEELDQLRQELYGKIHWDNNSKTGKSVAQWWIDRDVDALEAIDPRLEAKFKKMLKCYIED